MRMKLCYCKNKDTNILYPGCWFHPKYDVLGSYFMDSMGLILNSKEFIEELESSLKYLKSEKYPKYAPSNSWGLDIEEKGKRAFIYFLFDDKAIDSQTEIAEEKVIFFLEKWINFLKLKPKEEYEEIWEA